MLDCLNDEELSTLGELLQRIIDNTDTKLLDEEISERRKADPRIPHAEPYG